MLKTVFVLVLCLNYNNGQLLPIYQMEDYKSCQKNHTFCAYDFKITPQNDQSVLWKIIQETKNDPSKLDRSFVSRMICVPNTTFPWNYGKQLMENELIGLNATVDVVDIQCEQNLKWPLVKTVFWLFAGCFLAVTLEVTRNHFKQQLNNSTKSNGANSFLDIFSPIKNVRKLFEDNPNEDFQRLKSIQGVRVFNTALIVFWHTVVSLTRIYMDNVEQLEKNFEHPIVFYLMFLGGFSVQIFFLISTFLLTNQIYGLNRKQERFTLGHCGILIVNRLFRFFPTILLMVTITQLNLYDGSVHMMKTVNMCVPSCQRYGWYTVLMITYLLPFSNICTPGYWYLSVDTLFYIVTLGLLYVVLKYQLNIQKLIGTLVIGSIISFTTYLYWNDYEFMFQPFLRYLKSMDTSEVTNKVYVPPLASWPSSLFGILLGHIYYHNKHKQIIVISKKLHYLWWFAFISMPLTALHISTKSFSGLTGSLVGATLKPIFVLPLGIGLLGMAFGLGGAMKRFLESKPLAILANTTYCTYICHFFVVFSKGYFLNGLFHYETHHLVFWIIFDMIAAFGLGTICAVLIENPGIAFQKRFLPQIKTPQKKQS